MSSENGEAFIKSLAQFVRTHEKALANALQLRRERIKNGASTGHSGVSSPTTPTATPTRPAHSFTSNAFAAAFSFGGLNFTSHSVKPAKLTLTPHHLFFLLSRFEDLGVDVGPMSVRLENLHAEQSPANYVSFLSQPPRSRGRGGGDRDSIHSVSSVRSAMSNMTTFWSSLSLGAGASSNNAVKSEKAKAQAQADLKYLYSAFTKIPCLRLSPDRHARLISGYEEFPFDTAVPLVAFKNVSALEVIDLDFRALYGWDRLADQLRSLTVKRASIDDPTDLLLHVVLDDMEKRRRRSSKPQSPPTPIWPASPQLRHAELHRFDSSSPGTSDGGYLGSSASPRNNLYLRGESTDAVPTKAHRNKSASPTRPASSRHGTPHRPVRAGGSGKMRRSGSGSSNSSSHSLRGPSRDRSSSSNLLALGILPASKWRFLRHLSLADNALTAVSATALAPLANTLQSLDLSANLFVDVPDCLSALTALRALNLAHCMIASLHSLARTPLPAITALNLRGNRLASIAGVERLPALERLDVRANRLADPTELARLTGIPDLRELWVRDNPFVRSHANTYRVTIFNLFRATPGYAEDVVIDAAGPGYSERRALRERAAEVAPQPVVRRPSPDAPPVAPIIRAPAPPPHPTARADADAPPAPRPRAPLHSQSEVALGPVQRRRKGLKRRIVDLAVDDGGSGGSGSSPVASPQPGGGGGAADRSPTHSPTIRRVDAGPADNGGGRPPLMKLPPSATHAPDDPFLPSAPVRPPARPAATTIGPAPRPPVLLHTASSPPGTATGEAPAPPLLATRESDSGSGAGGGPRAPSAGAEAYRRRAEALKAEFGASWLQMLGQDGGARGTPGNGGVWRVPPPTPPPDAGGPTAAVAPPPPPPPGLEDAAAAAASRPAFLGDVRSSSQPAVVGGAGGRTLG